MERSIGRPGADLYLQDLATGERVLLLQNINDRYLQPSPGGEYLLFMDDGHFWTISVSTREITNITESAPISFINYESDLTSKVYPDEIQKPPFGVAGWTTSDASVLLYDRYDIWSVASDGSGAVRLTDGATEEVRHRLVRPDRGGLRGFRGVRASPDPEDDWIDLDEPVYISLYGEWTKKSGYGLLDPDGGVERLVWLDNNVGSLTKAENAETYSYIAQAYDDSPDIFVSGPDLRDAKQVTETNPFQSDFDWGHSELVDYVTDRGRKMQASLIYPAGYEAGKQYPMIVYNYELLSQNVHRYVAPSDRSYYNTAVFMSNGYFVLQPDIYFRTRQPGWSVVECVTAAVEAVLETGMVDPERVGIIGHSMGGFNTSFVATHTHGVFAAAVAGAPITDLVSYYGDHHWGSGVAETDHIETGQERMEVALYEDLQAYIDNSAVYGAHEMTVPLLLEAGDQDGIVAWYQAIELYNIARRAKRNVVLLGYIGEDHGLRQEANQKDYQRRILAWFGHYLKGEPAEAWITEGKSYLAREAELKRLRVGG
jgi:dienelactone hydrolase